MKFRNKVFSVLLVLLTFVSMASFSFADEVYNPSQATHNVKAYMDSLGLLPIPDNHGDKAFNGCLKIGNKLVVFVKEAEYKEKVGYLQRLSIANLRGISPKLYSGTPYNKYGQMMNQYEMNLENQPAYYVFDNFPKYFDMNEVHYVGVDVKLYYANGHDDAKSKQKNCYLWFEAK